MQVSLPLPMTWATKALGNDFEELREEARRREEAAAAAP